MPFVGKFFHSGIILIDITEADLYTGDCTDHENEASGRKENADE